MNERGVILGPKGQVGLHSFPGEDQGGCGEEEAKEVGGKFNVGQSPQKVVP